MKQLRVAIIGSRKTDVTLFPRMKEAILNSLNGFEIKEVRSGNAIGMDQLANQFDKVSKRIFHHLPWWNYNEGLIPRHVAADMYCDTEDRNNYTYIVTGEDERNDELLFKLFPWLRNKPLSFMKTVRRNYTIVMGVSSFDIPVDVVFWHTPTGRIEGGTYYGVKIAEHFGIKCVRLHPKE